MGMTPDPDHDILDGLDVDGLGPESGAELLAALAEAHAAAAPDPLRATVLAAARAARTPGVTVGELGIEATGAECYAALTGLVHDVILALPAEAWERQARPYRWTTHELVGHLLAVERYTASLIGGPAFALPEGHENDHLAFGEPTIAEERSAPPEATAGRWWVEARAVSALAAALDAPALARVVSCNGFPMRVETLLKARAFELWAHMDDLCLAGGLALSTPPAGVLRAVSTTSVQSLPLILGFTGVSATPSHVRMVLTGSGGGAFSLAVAGGSLDDEPAATIVVDVVDYCRMAAKRLDRTAMHGQVHGDAVLAEQLFEAAQALAI
jgi:hypothetical protein